MLKFAYLSIVIPEYSYTIGLYTNSV